MIPPLRACPATAGGLGGCKDKRQSSFAKATEDEERQKNQAEGELDEVKQDKKSKWIGTKKKSNS